MEEIFQIGFSLYPLAEWDRVLPTAYIISMDKNGRLTYYKALAKKELLEGYGIRDISNDMGKALELVEQLTPSSIENYFNKNKKKKISIQSLFLEKEQKKVFSKYIDSRMHALLELCERNQFPVCWKLERKITFESCRMVFLPVAANAIMYFDKTVKGINYTLKLTFDAEEFSPSSMNIELINEMPGWISVDNKLVRIEQITGLRLKPFLKKESLFIPSGHAKEFFEKFVLENLHQVKVETRGFIMEEVQEISRVQCIVRDAFMENRFVVDIVFHYGETRFSYNEKATHRNMLKFDDAGEVLVRHVRRNPAKEEQYADMLLENGFHLNENKHFIADDSVFGVIHLLGKVQDSLSGIDISDVEIHGKKIKLSTLQWTIRTELQQDWFDIHGFIQFGGQNIAIARMIPYIREKNVFFPLGDGTFFIIPDEMMATLHDISIFGKWDGKALRLHKSQHTLLENIEAETGQKMAKNQMITATEINYTPSSNLKADLRPYQLHGVKWLLSHRENGLGCLLADDMGLGKTLQVISLLVHCKESFKNEPKQVAAPGMQLDLFAQSERIYQPVKALVILPASLVFNWRSELLRFAPFLHVLTYTGKQRQKSRQTIATFDVILTTYKTAVLDIDVLKEHRFEYVILDESQTIKNKDSQTFKLLNTLNTNHRVSLSGTPIENSMRELWAQMQFINPDVLGTFSFFEKNFMMPVIKNNDENKKQTLRDLISPYLLRRTKWQVAPELPEITRQIHHSEMEEEQAKRFEKEKSAIRNSLLDSSGKLTATKHHVLVSLLRLRQIANHPVLVDPGYTGLSGKMEDVKNELFTLWEAGYKVLVFSAFTSVLKMLSSWSDEEGMHHVVLTGEQNAAERQTAVSLFQSDENIKIFYISLKAGGVGLNLTAAEYIFILDPWWNPFIEFQAEARAHRIGQTKPVMVKKFISKGSIEEKILVLQERKKTLAEDLISENYEGFSLTDEDISELLQ